MTTSGRAKYLYDTMQGDDSIMEALAFDVACAEIKMEVTTPSFALTDSCHIINVPVSVLLDNANTLLNESFESGIYVCDGSFRNLFGGAPHNAITLGVSASHPMDTIPTNHSFENIMVFTHDPVDNIAVRGSQYLGDPG